jgi:uncharacterized RDD family membrane protein YckC
MSTVSPARLTPEVIAQSYDSSIVVRRWGATWIDFLVLIGSAIAMLALPQRLQGLAFAICGLFALAYYPVLEHMFGRTLGKLVCRVRVVDASGRNPSWGQALLRTLLRLVEVNPALLGGVPAGIVVLASKKRQRLGDMAANTYVLREEDLPRLTYSGGDNTAFAHPTEPPPLPYSPAADRWLLPVGRSGWAIAAGYLGLFSVLLLPAPFALVAGVLGLREIARTPGLGGKGRAIFGIVMGATFSALLLLGVAASILSKR